MPDADSPKIARARLRALKAQLLDADDHDDFADLLRGDVREALPADEHDLFDRIWWVINGGLHEDGFTPDQRWAVLLAVASEDWTRDYEPPTDGDEWRELRDGLWSTLDECPLHPPLYSGDFAQGAFEHWLGPEPEPDESADEAHGDEPEDLEPAEAAEGAPAPEPVGPDGKSIEQYLEELGFTVPPAPDTGEVRVAPQLSPLEQSILDMEKALADLLGPDWRAQPTEPGTEGMRMEQELDALGF